MASVSSNVFVHGYKKFLEQSLVFCDSDEGDIRQFTDHLSWKMPYGDDLVMIAESNDEPIFNECNGWKNGSENTSLKVNQGYDYGRKLCEGVENTGRWPCGVCGLDVDINLMQCTSCH